MILLYILIIQNKLTGVLIQKPHSCRKGLNKCDISLYFDTVFSVYLDKIIYSRHQRMHI
jgi:hypothetical protein